MAFLELGPDVDVAIRSSNSPGDDWIGRRVGRINLAPFAAHALVAARGDDYRDLPWCTFTVEAGPPAVERWIRSWAGDRPPRIRVSDGSPLVSMVEAGVVAALLPVELGLRRGLLQLTAPVPELGFDIWCLTHRDLRGSARIRAFMDTVVQRAGFGTE